MSGTAYGLLSHYGLEIILVRQTTWHTTAENSEEQNADSILEGQDSILLVIQVHFLDVPASGMYS